MPEIKRYQEYSYGVEETAIGEFVKYEDHAEMVATLQEQVRALAAENLNRQHLLDMIGETGNANFGKTRIETPATDHAIREIRALAVEEFAKHLRAHMQDGSPLGLLAMGADEFAARIRSGEQHDKA